MDTTTWATISGPYDIPEMGVYANDCGLFTFDELFILIERRFIIEVQWDDAA